MRNLSKNFCDGIVPPHKWSKNESKIDKGYGEPGGYIFGSPGGSGVIGTEYCLVEKGHFVNILIFKGLSKLKSLIISGRVTRSVPKVV